MTPSSEEALFALALAKPAAERARWLDRECGGNLALRARLEVLLAAHEQPEALLATQADPTAPILEVDFANGVDEAVGLTLGRYRLLERIGEGGCGVVYVAEQTEPVRRRVALKVIKFGSVLPTATPPTKNPLASINTRGESNENNLNYNIIYGSFCWGYSSFSSVTSTITAKRSFILSSCSWILPNFASAAGGVSRWISSSATGSL